MHIAELSPYNHAFVLERMHYERLSDANVHADLIKRGRLARDDASIDSAFLPRVLEHTPEPWRVLDEIRRVLKPGGVIGERVQSPVGGRRALSAHDDQGVRCRTPDV